MPELTVDDIGSDDDIRILIEPIVREYRRQGWDDDDFLARQITDNLTRATKTSWLMVQHIIERVVISIPRQS